MPSHITCFIGVSELLVLHPVGTGIFTAGWRSTTQCEQIAQKVEGESLGGLDFCTVGTKGYYLYANH